MQDTDFIVVGSGVFGSTVAERLASKGKKVTVFERRTHLAGNAFSYRDPRSGIEIHKYGSHIFHTKDDAVFEYLSKFTEFNNYIHTVNTRHDGKFFPMPVNLDTINLLYNTNFNAEEAEKFVTHEAERDFVELAKSLNQNPETYTPQNFEEQGIKLVGRKLYETFLKNYTEKQWNTDAKNIPADILKRIPVRFSRDNRYFIDAKYQGVPKNGYGKMVEKMLQNPNIEVKLNSNFIQKIPNVNPNIKVIYTGQVDELLNYELGVLPYRSLRFEQFWVNENNTDADHFSHFLDTEKEPKVSEETLAKIARDSNLKQTVINEADKNVPYTRSHFYKYYQIHDEKVLSQPISCVMREYPADFKKGSDAYYPVNNAESEKLYENYVALLAERYPNIILGGRLGKFRYWDMDVAVKNALELAEEL